MGKLNAKQSRHLAHLNMKYLKENYEDGFIYGLDFSKSSTGYSILKRNGEILETGTIENPQNSDYVESVMKFHRELKSLFKKYPPSVLGYEQVSASTHFTGTQALSIMLGAFCLTVAICLKERVLLIPVNISSIKKAATGSGRFSKKEVKKFAKDHGISQSKAKKQMVMTGVHENFGILFEQDDECDAYVCSVIVKCILDISFEYDKEEFDSKYLLDYLKIESHQDKPEYTVDVSTNILKAESYSILKENDRKLQEKASKKIRKS